MTATAKTPSSSSDTGIGGIVQEFPWSYEGQKLSIVYETLGEGAPVLLLPAFSTVSTRAEMRGLAEKLASRFQFIAIDWPGFGQSSRLPLDYQPSLYQQFLQDFVSTVFAQPVAVIAAGHAAGYVMHLTQQLPQALAKVVLVAPTWRGPLPSMGEHRQIYHLIKNLVRSRSWRAALRYHHLSVKLSTN